MCSIRLDNFFLGSLENLENKTCRKFFFFIITFSRNEHIKFNFKDWANVAPDAAGCSLYVLVSVAQL